MALLIRAGAGGGGILLGILVRDVLRSYPNSPGGHSRIKVTGMLIGKFKLNPGGPMWVWLKLNPSLKGDFCVVSVRAFFVNFFAIPIWARIVTFHPKHPKWDQNLQFTPQSETTSILVTFIWESPPRVKSWPSFRSKHTFFHPMFLPIGL